MRNIVPRQGTETVDLSASAPPYLIEKYSSPTGDGNKLADYQTYSVAIEKYSSPTGDGNTLNSPVRWKEEIPIEKYSSPTGDGNMNKETGKIELHY